jgi:glycolate oxidase
MIKLTEQEVSTMVQDLQRLINPKFITTSLLERINNATDYRVSELDRESLPYVVVRPGSAEEVSKLMAYANSKKIPVFVRGSGTCLKGSSSYPFPGIVLRTSRLTHLSIYKDYGFFECGPGLRVQYVADELAKEGYYLPIHPGSIKIASMGGMVSSNTSGHIIDTSIGKPRDYVLGLQVVLPTGEILETGTKGLRRPAGTDLTQYFVGGDGLLGIITNIRLRLLPAFKSAYGVVFFDNTPSLVKGVQRIYLERVPPPLFMEFIDARCAEIGFRLKGLPHPVGPVLMYRAIGETEEVASYKIERLNETIGKEKPVECKRVTDMEYWDKVWGAREVISPYIQRELKATSASCEVVSTVADLLDCYRDCEDFQKGIPILEELGKPYLFGHIGALTFHPGTMVPVAWPSEKKTRALEAVMAKETQLNLKYGTCGGEWGQFARRTAFHSQRYGEKATQLVKAIKRAFDPNYILNPSILPEE